FEPKMKFPLFNLNRSGAIQAFVLASVVYGCLGGILPAAELRPLVGDGSKTPILPQDKPALIETNRSTLSVSKGRVPEKPNELNFKDLINGGPNPLPLPPRAPTTSERKDDGKDDLLNQESAWGNVTPQDVLDDYMARHILKMPQYAPDG